MCSVYFLGQGTGVLNIQVECMNVTQTYIITDCLFYDKGITGSGNENYYGSGISKTVDDNGTLLQGTTENANYIYFVIPGNEVSWNGSAKWNGDIKIEVDIISYNGSTYFFKAGEQVYISTIGEVTVTYTDLENARIGFRLNGTSASLKFKNLKAYPI